MDEQIEIYKKNLQAAHEMVSALCRGDKTWTMRVPVDETRDPDVVIGQALRDADNILKNLETLTADIEAAQRFHALTQLLHNRFDTHINFVEWSGSVRVIFRVSKPDNYSAEFEGDFSDTVRWAHHWAMHI